MVNFLFHIAVFIIAFLFSAFCANLWLIYVSNCYSCISHDHDKLSYLGLKICKFLPTHTDPALLFFHKSLRCATSNSSKNLRCPSAILSMLEYHPPRVRPLFRKQRFSIKSKKFWKGTHLKASQLVLQPCTVRSASFITLLLH